MLKVARKAKKQPLIDNALSIAVDGHPPRAQWQSRITGLEYHRAGSIAPHAQNWRGHGAAQQRTMAGLLDEIGIAGALLCYRSPSGVITLLDGHMRQNLDSAQMWPCLMLDVSEDEASTILATYDPLGAMATTAQDKLDSLLATTQSDHAAVQALLDALGSPVTPSAVHTCHQVCTADALTQYPVALGQVWQLGRHTLLCGDSTDPASYAQLGLARAQAALCLTDPPYGVGVSYAGEDGHPGAPGDTPQRVRERGEAFLSIAATYCRTILVTTGISCMYAYPKPEWVLSWVCPAGTGVGPWGFCCWHPVLAYGVDPYRPGLEGSRPDTLVLNATSPKDTGHPCPKPLDVWSWLMQRGSTTPGGVVMDPFMGSGTSILVAEQLDRTCYGIELAPEYVAITLARWAAQTGKTPELRHG